MVDREHLEPRPLPEAADAEPAREAAVLILVYEIDSEPHLVLTRRTRSVATHKGEISLPGGARDPDDPSLLATALREAAEEIGIVPETVAVLGELAPVNTVVSGFEVVPFVAWSASRPVFQPRPDEVAEVIELPLAALLRPNAVEEEVWEIGGVQRLIAFFRYGEYKIWGATYRILRQFVDRLAAGEYPAAPRVMGDGRVGE